jgi:SNF2 family DNA or RNA helicase
VARDVIKYEFDISKEENIEILADLKNELNSLDYNATYLELSSVIFSAYKKLRIVSEDKYRFKKFASLLSRLGTSEKIVIWETSPDHIQGLSNYYTNKGIKNVYIDGSVDKDTRANVIDQFDKDPDIKYMFISSLTSAEAWEIPSRTDCKKMVFYGLPSRMIHFEQCIDRLHRINSKEPVKIYVIIAKNTLDEWAWNLLQYKKKVKDGMLNNYDYKKIEELSIKKLLKINLDEEFSLTF